MPHRAHLSRNASRCWAFGNTGCRRSLRLSSWRRSSSAARAPPRSRTDPLLAPPTACPGSASTAGTTARSDERDGLSGRVRTRTRRTRRQLHESKTLDRAATLKIDADVRCGQFSHTPCSQQFASTFAAAGYPMAAATRSARTSPSGRTAPARRARSWPPGSPRRRTARTCCPASWKSFGLGCPNRKLPRLLRRRDLGQRVRQPLRSRQYSS